MAATRKITLARGARTAGARTSQRRQAAEPPSWAELETRAGTRDACMPEELPGLSPDARMVATLYSVVAQLSKHGQLFLTNGYLSSWSADLARALRRLGTPRARALAEMHAELVAIAKVACVRERNPVYETDEQGEFDPVLDELAARLHAISQRVIALDPALRRDLAAHLEGARPRPRTRPWPRAPRITYAIREAWG